MVGTSLYTGAQRQRQTCHAQHAKIQRRGKPPKSQKTQFSCGYLLRLLTMGVEKPLHFCDLLPLKIGLHSEIQSNADQHQCHRQHCAVAHGNHSGLPHFRAESLTQNNAADVNGKCYHKRKNQQASSLLVASGAIGLRRCSPLQVDSSLGSACQNCKAHGDDYREYLYHDKDRHDDLIRFGKICYISTSGQRHRRKYPCKHGSNTGKQADPVFSCFFFHNPCPLSPAVSRSLRFSTPKAYQVVS